MNIYKSILERNLHKLLNLYNLDEGSDTYGYGDREYWGWKTKDFANATLQGGVHSLAIACKLGIFKETKLVLKLVDASIKAIARIRAKNGSVVEAYPNEHSFCVTALVAFDVLSAMRVLDKELSDEQKREYLTIIRPLITFISNNDEEHAIISNHLATGVAAIALWNQLSGEQNKRYQELLDIIYAHQSDEGWYKEYEGADPGYQTLCTYYLAAAQEVLNDDRLEQSLKQSAAFLKHFIHPDSSIGGLYGSRNTEVYYPGGIVALASLSDDFACIANFVGPRLDQMRHILPEVIDIGNYIPHLNSYAFAAYHYEQQSAKIETCSDRLPFVGNFEQTFPETGIYIKSTASYYAIVNYYKGGTLKVFRKDRGMLDIEDGGFTGLLNNKMKVNTQLFDQGIDFDTKKLKAYFYKSNEAYPDPFKFIVLRGLALTVFRSVRLGNVFKNMIVKMLMTGKNRLNGYVEREFEFGESEIQVREHINAPKGVTNVRHCGKSKAIHMASSGYFLKQNSAQLTPSEIVRFNEI